ncbi:MAG TPA: hypothetical protein PKW80_06255 [Bacteroidales bacterium]|nr:hypothetical protein [Bacteroidales bacterium]
MFTRIFKYHTNFQIAFIFIAAIALWMPAFIKGYPLYEPFRLSFGYNFIYYSLYDANFLIYTAIAFVLLLGEAVFLHEILAEFKIIPKNSYITAFFYVLLMSSTPPLLTLHPILIVNGLVMMLLLMFFRIKTKEEGYKEIFLCGLLTGICSLFYFKSAGLICIVWIFLLIFHFFSWREWLISITGLMTVYLYLFTYFLLTDQLMAAINEYRQAFTVIDLGGLAGPVSVYQYLTVAIMLALFLVSAVNIYIISSDKVIYVRKIFNIIFWLFLLNTVSMLFLIRDFIYEFSYLLFPVSIMVSCYYVNQRKILLGEIALTLLIISIILQKVFIG